MATEVKCPGCGYGFPIEEVMAEEYKKELKNEMLSYKRKKDEEAKRTQEENQRKVEDLNKQVQQQNQIFEERLINEKKTFQQQLEQNLRKTIASDFENKILLLENSNKDSEEKLKLSRQKEFEILQKEKELENKRLELDLEVQRKTQQLRSELTEQILKQEADKNISKENEHQFKIRELEEKLDQQKKLAEEMKRKAEQGSMQLQGEVQELILEELLRNSFPFDVISEVGKGIRGADCVQTVRNQFGQECGRIIYESKRTKDFGGDWIEKLKKDMRSQGVDVAVIVSQCYPKGMDCFGERDGVWICSFEEAKAVASVLRDGVIRLSNVMKSQENRGDKMHLLYNYLTSSEFSEQWKAVQEGFMSMRQSIQQERNAMEKLWKSREKQLEKVLLNAAFISGSIEGIAGSDQISFSLTGSSDEFLLE